jgi:hypothetical protein
VSKRHSEKFIVSRRNKLRRDSEREVFNREESFKIPQVNVWNPFEGSGIVPDHHIWESWIMVSHGFLQNFVNRRI